MASVFEADKLVVFVGAGVSALPPANLPDWWGFNTLLLNGAKGLVAAGLPELPTPTRERLAALSLDEIPVEAFSEMLFDSFAGSSYFPVLGVLDGDRPNANHFALVELARRGRLAAIVSTNFDTLIELAFRQLAVPLQVVANAETIEKTQLRAGLCTLFKIHGSVTETTTLVDTVRQKLQGLPVAIRETLAALFRRHPVLVLGYSGADLSFGDDYLALLSATDTSPGIAWLVRPGTPPRPAVREILERAGDRGAMIIDSLPQVFARFGLDPGALAPAETVTTPDDETTGPGDGTPQSIVADFFRQRHAGIWGAAAFCARLLERIGDEGHLHALLETLEQRPELDDGPHDLIELLPTGAVLRNLATQALRRGETERARHWSLRELAIHRVAEEVWARSEKAMPPETAIENARNRAGVWNNLTVIAASEGDARAARQALARCEHFATASDSRDLLAKAAFQRAQILLLESAPWDSTLEALAPALDLAAQVGDGATRLDALLLRARALISLIEYDLALQALDQAAKLLGVAGGVEAKARVGWLRAAIVARRGDEATADAVIEATLDETLDAGAAGTALRTLMATLGPSLLSPILLRVGTRHLARLLLRIGSAEDRSDELHQRAEALVALDLDSIPEDIGAWLRFEHIAPAESALRTTLARLEQRGETSVPLAEAFQGLWRDLYRRSRNIPRLRDLAKAYFAAAERSGSPQQVSVAWGYLATTHDLAGELDEAIAAYERSLATDPDQKPGARAKSLANIALVKSHRGDDDAEGTLRRAIDALRAHDLVEDAFRSMLNLARHLARAERYDEALETLEQASKHFDDLPTAQLPLARGRLGELTAEFAYAARRQTGEPWNNADIDYLLDHPTTAHGPKPDREALAAARQRTDSPESLANLGIVTMSQGHLDLAREMIEAAKETFEARGDVAGVSRCLNNLAAIEANEGRHQAAIALSRQALGLRRQLGDLEGQALTLSELARLHFVAGQLEPTIEVASQCLGLLDRQGPHRARLVALTYLALALGQQGRWIEARVAARRRRREHQVVAIEEDPNIERILEQLAQQASAEVAGDGPTTPEDPATTAHRLSQLGLIDEALELIDGQLGTTEDPRIVAGQLGNKAHILNNAGRLDEARPLYLDVAERFCKLGDESSRLEAERQAARCASALGERDAAEARLRTLLEDVPPGPARGALLRTLAAVIQQRLADIEGTTTRRPRFDTATLELDAERLANPEIRALFRQVGEQTLPLLEEAADMPGQSEEEQGIQRLNLGLARLHLLGDPDGAEEILRQARPHLLAANSAHLALCDQLLESLSATEN